MSILITGLAGNLGQAIKRQADMPVNGIDRGGWSELRSSLKDAEVVIHAASDLKTSIAEDPEKVFDSNLMSTVRLLETMKEQGSKARLFFMSSCAVYGYSGITREDVAPAPISINGITKLLNERFIVEFCERHGISYTILRLFNLFGGQDHFSMLFHLQESLKQKKPFVLFNGGLSQRDFIHVDDAAKVIVQMVSKPQVSGIYNLGSGNATRVIDVVNAFKQKHPGLELVSRERVEAEYSRADISKLAMQIVLPDFQDVLEFIANQ